MVREGGGGIREEREREREQRNRERRRGRRSGRKEEGEKKETFSVGEIDTAHKGLQVDLWERPHRIIRVADSLLRRGWKEWEGEKKRRGREVYSERGEMKEKE